jgi:hypothetical protein
LVLSTMLPSNHAALPKTAFEIICFLCAERVSVSGVS